MTAGGGSLRGRIALVTGSTSGIGRGIAESLAASGADIILNGFGDPAAIDRQAAALAAAHGISVEYRAADMARPAEIRDLIAGLIRDRGAIDILVNNAGVQFVSPLADFPEAEWDRLIAVNLSAAFHAMKAALPAMRARGYGRIVNIASVHGLVASIDKAAYVAAKHGLIGLTKVAALECAGSGVTVNAICPGWVLTPLVERQIEARLEAWGGDRRQAEAALIAEKQPSRHFVTPEAIGEFVLFLASPAAAEITGTALPIDGGWTAQ